MLTWSFKATLLDSWYKQAQVAGVPLCEFLHTKAETVVGAVETGAGQRIISTSNAGQSVTYGDTASDVVPLDETTEFLMQSAQACEACTGTDEEKLACLKANVAPTARYLVKSYTGLRGCGC